MSNLASFVACREGKWEEEEKEKQGVSVAKPVMNNHSLFLQG